MLSGGEEDLSLVGKILSAVCGPVTGMLPPRLQMRLSRDNTLAASIMSTSSRAFNIAWSAYSAVSLIGRAFGMDIDPTPGNAATLLGLGVAADTAVREVCYGLHYYMNHPNSTYSDPWGEPILSLIDANRHPEWYH